MLNCFYGYSFIWSIILVLYSFNITSFNGKLHTGLLFFIISTIIISFIIGYINRKKFRFKYEAVNYSIKPVIFISIGFIMNFIYAKSIPFFQIAITKSSLYGDFEGIPLFYVFIIGISFYYGINYFNAFLNIGKHKKQSLFSFFIIAFFYLLCYSRSMILFLLLGAFILYIQYKKEKKNVTIDVNTNQGFKNKNRKVSIITIIIVVFIGLIIFGGLGNVRVGLSFNDNSYIERIGLYNQKYPKFLPKQLMWSYSYLTSPLANLNYNYKIYHDNHNFNIRGVLNELMNRSFSKRIFPELNHNMKEEDFGFELEHSYFNAATGYCFMYIYGGIVGMYLQFFTLMTISYLQISLIKKDRNKGKGNGTYIILLIINTLMFFYNTLNTTTMSWWIIVNFFALMPKIKMKWSR